MTARGNPTAVAVKALDDYKLLVSFDVESLRRFNHLVASQVVNVVVLDIGLDIGHIGRKVGNRAACPGNPFLVGSLPRPVAKEVVVVAVDGHVNLIL